MVWNVPQSGQGVKAERHTWEERFQALLFFSIAYHYFVLSVL